MQCQHWIPIDFRVSFKTHFSFVLFFRFKTACLQQCWLHRHRHSFVLLSGTAIGLFFFKKAALLYTAMLDENSLTAKKLYKRPPHVILFPLYPWSSLRCWQLVGFSFDFSHRQRYYYTDCVIWEFLLVFNRSISKMILFLSTISRHNIHKMLRFF